MNESEDTIIIADSSSELPEGFESIIPVVKAPCHIITEFNDHIDDGNINIENLIDEMNKSKKGTKSACPSPDDFLNLIKKFKNLKNIFIVTLSSKLSGSYNSANLAKNIYQDENDKCNIHVVDSHGAAATETKLILRLNEIIKEHKEKLHEVNFNEAVSKIEDFKDSLNTYFVLESYDNFVKNGRISKTTALIGNALHIVPVMKGIKGEIASAGKARGINKALYKLVCEMKENIKDFSNTTLVITHCLADDHVNKVLDYIKEENINFKEIIITKTEGLSSMYAEKGGVIVSY